MTHLVLLASALSCFPQVQVREEVRDWKLIKTEHFDVYYPADELLPRAKEFAGWFEEARGRIKEATGTEVKRRISVFLFRSYHDLMQASFLGQFDFADTSRALLGRGRVFEDRARPQPARFCRFSRRRALALAEPLHDRILIHCQASDRWNLWFLRHELAHHAQFEAMFPWRIPSWLLAVKDPLVPAWWWEGGADFFADVFESHKDEYVRDLSMERLYGLKELYGFDTQNFYDFIAPYYEGSYFWRFLDEQYGAGKSKEMFKAFTGFPIFTNRLVARVTGKGVKAVEADFARSLSVHYTELLNGRRDASEFATRVTDTREYYRRRTWGGRFSPNGSLIAYVSDVDTVPELFVAEANGANPVGVLGIRRGIDLEGIHSAPSWAPDGNRLVVAGWWKNHDYLLFVDVDGGFTSVRPDFDEVHDPAFSPDGTSVVFSGLKAGYSDLYVWRDGAVTRLTEDRDADSMPAWSPDGRWIVYVSETEARPRLYLYDVKERRRRMLLDSFALVEHPRWMSDSGSVVVSADVGGVFDLFRITLEGKVTRLTKVRRGAHFPDPSADGRKVLFTYFQERGSDLYVMNLQEEPEGGFTQEDRRSEYERFTRPDPQGEPAQKTRSFDLEYLMGPVTSFSFLTPGFEARIADLDAENSLNLGGMFFGSDAWGASASVINTRWQPTLAGVGFAGESGDLQYAGLSALVFEPLTPNLMVLGGWTSRETQDREPSPDQEFEDNGPVVGGMWTNLDGYHLHDPSWGVALGGTFTYFDEDFNGDRDLRESFAFLETASDVTQDWITWARLSYLRLDGREFLDDEHIELGRLVRGADDDFEGRDAVGASAELRFPLYRDAMWMPLELMSTGEWFVIKDLRGFAFADGGYAGSHFEDFEHGAGGAVSVGLGARMDFFFMLFPVFNVRVPLRLETWGALVTQDEHDPRGEFGVGIGF